MRHTRTAIASAALSIILLGACSSGGDGDDEGGEASDAAMETATASDVPSRDTTPPEDSSPSATDADSGSPPRDTGPRDSAPRRDGRPDTLPPVDILVCNQNNWSSECDYEKLSKASNAVSPGEVVGIRAGTYEDCAKWSDDGITIRGVGGRPHLENKVCALKGIFVVTTGTDDVTIRNIEFSGMSIPVSKGGNGAGIRHQGGELTVRNVYAHDGQEGILAGGGAHTIRIVDSKFENLGKNGLAHDIYINKVDELVVRDSEFLSAKSQGHELKTRARKTVVECSTVAALDGRDSRSLDISNGGETILRNNVIEQGPNSVNSTMIGYAPEGAGTNHPQSLTMKGNVLINDLGKGRFVSVNDPGGTSLTIENNEFYGNGTELAAGSKSLPASNKTDLDRDKAFGAFPKLPDPACP